MVNFKTEESQRRLLTAVIAAHPELKLNFKAISQHFGPEEWGKDGIEHFFRPLRGDARIVREMVMRGEAPKSFYDNKKPWQFRSIKQNAEVMRQTKNGGANASASANGAPVTPKTVRKRAAPLAPSSGKPSASKKSRGTAAKAAAQVAPAISLDDDDDDNEFPPISMLDTPIKGPRFTEAYERQFFGTDAPPPALDTTQGGTPNEDEDIKPHTPSDAAAFSFSQAPLSSGASRSNGVGYNLDTYPISQPSFVTNSGYSKTFTTDDFDDEV